MMLYYTIQKAYHLEFPEKLVRELKVTFLGLRDWGLGLKPTLLLGFRQVSRFMANSPPGITGVWMADA